jgi:cytochrome c
MKKLLILLSFSGLGLLFACGGGEDKNAETEARKNQAEAAPEPAEPAADADYEKGLELVGKSDCFTCHKVNEQAVGPAYQAVADKYEKTDENITKLAEKVIKGGAGVWGQVPMTAHPQLSKEDAIVMVKYVLSLKK